MNDPSDQPDEALEDRFEDDHFRDECGVFGVYGHPEAANVAYLGLHALQHRGQESTGIATLNESKALHVHRAMGLVQDAFPAAALDALPGPIAIGHVRYSTAGGSHLRNAQPLTVDHRGLPLACAHNGNLTNTDVLRAALDAQGALFQTTTDTELFLHLIARAPQANAMDRVVHALCEARGAFSVLFLAGDTLIAARDPHGLRPLCLGRLGDAWVVASEPVAFDLIAARFERDLAPGEVLIVTRDGARSVFPFAREKEHFCVFEHVYFARPDSTLGGRTVYQTRKRLGALLAAESPAEADVVVPVPDSGVPAAIGFAEVSKLPFEMGLIRSHYVGRTFIEPSQSIRHFGVRLKLNPVRAVLEGRRVVVVDDSIVRGTTSRKIVKMLRDAGAREVHLRISSPPTRWPCFYGIDTPDRGELIAATHSPEEIARYVTSDTLAYLSLDGLRTAVGSPNGNGFCEACFTGEYPVDVIPGARLKRR